ncbi:helix-turn-helix transcriptional regulator [Viridibacillus sp. FSL R5-0477]|uniref:Transcription regulator PadR N-terminal domain-containing protein n=1 Tax=Viridibacillus arenosi FSL R5-213 TaxID=1227360 RepID=W4EP79_9BACL|nr:MULTISPECIES: helix-turn-helix transcriptional regulator [Viridibacillus]ETT82413.1 hypothetical protein C176_15522 [Viridibacillus arenosi FSL R5-213]OMC85391.1 PadR family transcriptional regulator [Viridibacillus sp. FSL H8-0123]OMC87331.1 PadR family transcriptional regulator [Viridibacillus sp. FSL H7-0596]OMC92492.1 PadR family transcriptional regulator [Viridibacillus arenosi]
MQQHGPLTEGVYYILLALYEPRHGYGIMQLVESLSKGRVQLGPGTLYGALKSLVERGWIETVEAEESTRKKQYMITAQGKSEVEAEIIRMKELIMNGELMIKGGIE